jgi:hypothetical protein
VAGQLSLFGADTGPAGLDDLDGLLAGPGQVVRGPGGARVSVIVADPWRVAALAAEYAARGLKSELGHTEDGQPAVRTAFDPALEPLAVRWMRGSRKAVPSGFVLDGPRLRCWALAAGRADPGGYLLALGPHDRPTWRAMGKALAAAGFPAEFVGPRAHGPGYRITGARRLIRLAELLGVPPDGADWPDSLVPP